MTDQVTTDNFFSILKKHSDSIRGLVVLARHQSTLSMNPHPVFHQVRAINPVLWVPKLRLWFVTGYDEVAEVLRSPSVGWGPPPYREGDARLFEDLHYVERIQSQWLLFQDVPEHTQLRSLIQQAFSRWGVVDLRPIIQETVDGLLDKLSVQREVDLINHFACPLPLLLVMRLTGLPVEDYEQLSEWLEEQSATLEVSRDDVVYERGNESASKLIDYFKEMITKRRTQPEDDLISFLIQAKEEDISLDDEVIATNLIMLMIGGYENVKNAIGLCVWSLSEHPGLWQMLRDKPEILPEAIEELLRYETPGAMVYRRALTDLTLGDSKIRQGQGMAVVLSAANRDPKHFVDPDHLDFYRRQHGIPFGAGMHTCLGAQLARLELQLALGTLMERFPDLTVQRSQAKWLKKVAFRGLEILPVDLKSDAMM